MQWPEQFCGMRTSHKAHVWNIYALRVPAQTVNEARYPQDGTRQCKGYEPKRLSPFSVAEPVQHAA